MINNNHKKSGCGFAEELVSYVYGEADAAGSAAEFEAHLAGCSICAGELEAFSGVHTAIGDWKAAEFAPLETPVIEIPYPQTASIQQVSDGKESWLSALVGELFSLSPRGLSLAAACVVVLTIAVGAVLYLSKSPGAGEVAITNSNSKTAVAPTVEKSPAAANNIQNVAPPTQPQQPIDPKTPPRDAAIQPETKNNRVVKVTNNPRPTTKAENTNSPKSTDAKRNIKNKEIPARSMPDEDEDDTLRLAELFEEIETRE